MTPPRPAVAAETRLFATRPGEEAPMLAELGRVFPRSRHAPAHPGLVASAIAAADAAAAPCVAFALQCVPRPEPVSAPSISAWADAGARRIAAGLAGHDGPWRLHVFCCEEKGSEVRGRRCALVEAGIRAELKRRWRRLLRSLVAFPAAPRGPDEALAQIVLATPRAGYASIALPAELARLGRAVSRFPGGRVAVADDPAPPSRAYRKLLEAELRLGAGIAAGDLCADLGAAPGGWTHVALARGARVIAVDRSPLRADLMASPRLEFVAGDAFRWAPAQPVDWLLSDVIAYPARILELVDRWLAARLCRRFVVTVKFKGAADHPEVQRLEALLAARGAAFEVRRLEHNKNEVTAFGTAGRGA